MNFDIRTMRVNLSVPGNKCPKQFYSIRGQKSDIKWKNLSVYALSSILSVHIGPAVDMWM